MGGARRAQNLTWRIPRKMNAVAGVATPLSRYGNGRGLCEQARSMRLLDDVRSSIGVRMFTDYVGCTNVLEAHVLDCADVLCPADQAEYDEDKRQHHGNALAQQRRERRVHDLRGDGVVQASPRLGRPTLRGEEVSRRVARESKKCVARRAWLICLTSSRRRPW